MTLKCEKLTSAPLEKIFDVATDFESFQTRMEKFFPSIRIISVRPNTTLVEEHIVLAGKELVVMAKHTIEKPHLHETLIVGGDAKGSHIIEQYKQISTGTKITISIEFKSRGKIGLSGIFNKGKFENEFSKIYDELIYVAEN